MAIDHTYSDGTLALGCLRLATDPGPIKERLAHAAAALSGVNAEAFVDPSVGEMWADIWRRLTAIPAQGNEDAIAATINAMDETAACELASDIIDIWQVVTSGKRT